jgi:hypothetical protein
MAQQQNDPLTAEMQNSLGQLRNRRLEVLDAASNIQVAFQSALLNEAQRLETKLGAENSRTRQLRERAQANVQLTQSLRLENEVTRVVLPEVEEEGALVYGRVADEDNLGIDRLTVRLVSPSGALDVDDAVTDESGAFTIALGKATVDRVIKTSPKGIQAAVYTPRGRVLYTQIKPVSLAHGARVVIPIRLLRQDLVGAPAPTPPVSTGTVKVPNVVGGSVRSARSKLKTAGLALGSISGTSHSESSIIEKQSPEAGSPASKGTTVSVTVRDRAGKG